METLVRQRKNLTMWKEYASTANVSASVSIQQMSFMDAFYIANSHGDTHAALIEKQFQDQEEVHWVNLGNYAHVSGAQVLGKLGLADELCSNDGWALWKLNQMHLMPPHLASR